MTLAGNKLINDGVWVLTGRVVSMLSGLLVIVFITRLLDSAEVGFYFLCFSLISILALFSQLGMNLAVVRLIAEALSNERHEQGASVATLAVKLVGKAIVVVRLPGLVLCGCEATGGFCQPVTGPVWITGPGGLVLFSDDAWHHFRRAFVAIM